METQQRSTKQSQPQQEEGQETTAASSLSSSFLPYVDYNHHHDSTLLGEEGRSRQKTPLASSENYYVSMALQAVAEEGLLMSEVTTATEGEESGKEGEEALLKEMHETRPFAPRHPNSPSSAASSLHRVVWEVERLQRDLALNRLFFEGTSSKTHRSEGTGDIAVKSTTVSSSVGGATTNVSFKPCGGDYMEHIAGLHQMYLKKLQTLTKEESLLIRHVEVLNAKRKAMQKDCVSQVAKLDRATEDALLTASKANAKFEETMKEKKSNTPVVGGDRKRSRSGDDEETVVKKSRIVKKKRNHLLSLL